MTEWTESLSGELVIPRDGVYGVRTYPDSDATEGDLRLNGQIVARSASVEPTRHRQMAEVAAKAGDVLTSSPDGRIRATRFGEAHP